MAATVPSCIAYDPTFGYEFTVIVQDGLRRMYAEGEAIFYYVTLLNENYLQPAMPEGVEEGIRRGIYLLSEGAGDGPRVQLMGCGSILREVIEAATLLRDEWEVASDVWSATSFTELARDGRSADRWNRLHPGHTRRRALVAERLEGREGPIIAATDYMGAFPEQIRPWVGRRFVTLGTDGFGRSDSREALRDWFEVDRHYVVHAALVALADDGVIGYEKAAEAMQRYGIRADKLDPTEV
jgi:pyruvate dehydrogenase E1 component